MKEIPLGLAVRYLLGHKLRATLTVASLAVAVFLLCLMRALVATLDQGVQDARSDRLVVQSAVSLFVNLPDSYRAKIRQVRGVKSVCSWTWFGAYYQRPENFFSQFAVDEETLFDCYPELEILEGSKEDFLRDGAGCLIGDLLAEEFGWSVGDRIPLVGNLFVRTDGAPWEFTVRAIYTCRTTSVDRRTLFFHYDFLDEARDAGACRGPAGVSVYNVLVEPDADPVDVMARIDALFENGPQRVQTTPESVFQAQFVSMIGNVPLFVSSLGGGVLFAILLAVVNTMLMAAREQTRDVGVLRALGFPGRAVFLQFLAQGLLLCAAGGAIGAALAKAVEAPLQLVAGTYFPGFEVSGATLALGAAISLAVGFAASIVPARRLGRLDPASVLRETV